MSDTYQSKYTGVEIDERLEWAEEISPHIAKQLNTETGIHGVRYWQDKLEYNDGAVWVEIETGGGGSFVVKGLYANLSDLIAAHPTGEAGDAYAVGSAEDNDIYIWSIVSSAWVNIGPLRGEKGDPGEDGTDGRGIVSVTRTSGTGAPGTTDTYTITYTDSTTSTFNVYNGADGTGAGDMQSSVYDPTGKAQDIFAYVDGGLAGKVDNARVLTDVPANAKFTDTVTTINGKTGAIAKADIVALGIPAQDTVVPNTRKVNNKALSSDITLDKSDIGLGNVDNAKQMPIVGGTFTGAVTAQSNTAYTTRQIRNIVLSTSDPSGGSNGDIWIKYT
jgi:hypothetical protein